MKNIAIFLLLLIHAFVYSQSGNTIIDSIMSNGIYRSYRLYIPSNYTGINPVPLILNLHGYTSNAGQQQTYSNFMPIADTAGFLMVYPQGKNDSYGNPFWNAGTAPTTIVNDTLFLNQLIDSLITSYNIDPTRVYMIGLSNGGFMSHYMACFCNKKITAIASVAGTIFSFWSPCSPDKIIPVLHIHGTADPTVPYNGNSTMLSADSTVQRWVQNNNCNATPSYSMVPNTNTFDGSTAEHYAYFKTGMTKSIVEFFKINNGAHTWPGSPFIIGTTNQDINASAEIWRFFRQFSSNDFPTSIVSNELNPTIVIYPNPATQHQNIYITITTFIREIQMIDISGKMVFYKNFSDPIQQIIIEPSVLAKGIYFVMINKTSAKKLIIN